jgi:hypothetical protein
MDPSPGLLNIKFNIFSLLTYFLDFRFDGSSHIFLNIDLHSLIEKSLVSFAIELLS